MTAVTVSSKYQIVIPKKAREKLKLLPGARLIVTEDAQGLRLSKEPTLDEIRGLLKGMKWKEAEVRDETDRELP